MDITNLKKSLDFKNNSGCDVLVSIIISVLLVTNVLYSTFVKYALVENKIFGNELASQLQNITNTSGGRYQNMMTQLIKQVVYILIALKLSEHLKIFGGSNMKSLMMLAGFTTIVSVLLDVVLGFVLEALEQGNVAGDFLATTPSLTDAPMTLLWQFILSSLVAFVTYFLLANGLCNKFYFIFMFFIALFVSLVFFKSN
jgi:hypothetical protein